MVHKQKFKDLLSSTCQASEDRVGLGRELDLESEVMRDLGSIPTGGNIFHWIFFCFHVVKILLPILALLPFLCILKKVYIYQPGHD